MLSGLPNRLKNFSRRMGHSQVRRFIREWPLMEGKDRHIKVLRKVHGFARATITYWPHLIVPFEKNP
jgi:hypothetical protein